MVTVAGYYRQTTEEPLDRIALSSLMVNDLAEVFGPPSSDGLTGPLGVNGTFSARDPKVFLFNDSLILWLEVEDEAINQFL